MESVLYIECSLPAGLTIQEYRRQRPKRASLWQRIKSLGAGAQPAQS